MKKFKFLLIGVTSILLIGSCKTSKDKEGENKEKENSPTTEQTASGAQASANQAATSPIVGIWHSPDEERDYFIFQDDGKIIHVKIDESKGSQDNGTYTLNGNYLRYNLGNENQDNIEAKFDGNNGMSLLIPGNEDRPGYQMVFNRVSQDEYDRRVSGVKEWN